MTIQFHCSHCGKKVTAPDAVGGRRGKCPYCQQSNYIPSPTSDDDIIDLAPLDDMEELRQKEMEKRLLAQEHDLIMASGSSSPAVEPLEQRSDLKPEDLYHYIVNYCLDMAGGKLEKAELAARELLKYRHLSLTAIADFLGGKTLEPALNEIPAKVIQGLLNELQTMIKKEL